MTTTMTTEFALTRVFDAPRALVYQAFTDPDHLAEWWVRGVHQAGLHARCLSVAAAQR